MKKFIITLLTILLTIPLIGQKRELSDYEKYRMMREDEMYAEMDSIKNDTVIIVQKEKSEPVVINNYYINDDEPNLRFLLTFDYGW